MKKRILSIFLILCLCAALLPTFAAADTPTIQGDGSAENPWILTQEIFNSADETTSPVTKRYSVGVDYYVLQEGYYQLGQDVTLAYMINVNNVTLDLNGHTLTKTGTSSPAILVEYGCLTLNDSSDDQSGTISGGSITVVLSDDSRFTMNGGTIKDGNRGVSLEDGATFTMNGGRITNHIDNHSGTIKGSADGVIEGGVLNDTKNSSSPSTITGGVFHGTVRNKGEITGGVFHDEVINEEWAYYSDDKKARITGGVFYGKVTNKGEITGGVFLGETDGFDLANAPSVTYDSGDSAKTGKVMGNKLSRPEDPTREGYTFLGWYNGNTPWDFENGVVTGDITLTARWKSEQPELETGFAAILDDVPFVDVDFNDYFYDAVKWAYHSGVTGGTDACHFSPDAGCTRAQAVTFLWRAAGCPSAAYLGNFTDVDADAYYAPAVAWAVANGVTNGTSATTFSPEAACSRGDIVTFLYRAFGGTSNGYHPFADVPASAYYADAVAWAYEHNVTGGTSADKFSPADACSRAQIVTFLYRVLG